MTLASCWVVVTGLADVADDVGVDVQEVAHRQQLGGVVAGHGMDVVGAEPAQELRARWR